MKEHTTIPDKETPNSNNSPTAGLGDDAGTVDSLGKSHPTTECLSLAQPPSNANQTLPESVLASPYWENIIGTIAPKKAPEPTNQRLAIVQKVREAAPRLFEFNRGAKLLAVSTVLAGLKNLGHKEFATNANFMGDCLGKACANLPRVTINGKRRYALHMLDATDEERRPSKPD